MNNINFSEMTGFEFEKFCKELLEQKGFQVQLTKKTGDGGIDLIAYNNQVFFSGKYIVQCKKYVGSVGEPAIRDLFGVVTAENANKGILITTGTFTTQAKLFAQNKPIELIDSKILYQIINSSEPILINNNLTFVPIFSNRLWNDIVVLDSKSKQEAILALESDYKILSEGITKYPHDYKCRFKLMNLLLANILSEYSNWHFPDNSEGEVSINKEQCIRKLISLTDDIIKKKPLTSHEKIVQQMMVFWEALLKLMVGDFVGSLECYFNFLRMPEVQKVLEYPDDYDIDTVLKVIFNISRIYNILDLNEKSRDIYRRYKDVLVAYLERNERIIKQNPNLEKYLREESDILFYRVKSNNYYLDYAHMNSYYHSIPSHILSIGFENIDEPYSLMTMSDNIYIYREGKNINFKEDPDDEYAFYTYEMNEKVRQQIEKIKLIY